MGADTQSKIMEALAEVLGDESDETLCASFRLRGAETPWVQVIPGVLNSWWPWEDEEPLERLRAAVPSIASRLELDDFQPSTFATFTLDADSPGAWADLVDGVFRELHGCPAGYEVETEIYALQDDEIPDRVPIAREEGSHTDTIGTYGDGHQFLAFVVATLPESSSDDWESQKRWYAVLHRFDAEGRHTGTDAEFFGTTADGEPRVVEQARARLQEWLDALDRRRYEDVAVELFSVEIDGREFGLFDATHEDEEEDAVHVLAELRPNELAFYPPWDGEYDT